MTSIRLICSPLSQIIPPQGARPPPSMTSAISRAACGSLIVTATSGVFTIARVAVLLGEDEEWLSDIPLEMDPEDARVTIYDIEDEGLPDYQLRHRQSQGAHRDLYEKPDYYQTLS